MMKIKVLFISILSLMFSNLVVAQEPDQDISAKLKELKAQESSLQSAVDSLGALLNQQRSLFESNTPDSDSIGEQIIMLEGSVFDYRSKLSVLGSNIAALEAQQSILDQKNNGASTQNQAQQGSSNILDSQFFLDNIASNDLNYFKESDRIMGDFEANIDRVNTLYQQLSALSETYHATQSQVVIDSIMVKAADMRGEISRVDRQISQSWGELFNRKLDNYMVLVDRLSSVDRTLLEQLDLLSRKAFAAEQQSGGSLAPSIISYIPQQELLLAYETLFAEKLKLQSAVDSLTKASAALAKKHILNYDDINYPYRSMVIYGDITLGNTYPYSDITEVPALRLPEKGVYYAVQVALVSKLASSLSIFKGAEPLQVEKTATGGNRYVLGGFKSYEKAAQAVKDCFAAQFKNPVLVAWVDGKYTTVSRARAYQTANPEITPAHDFQIEVVSPNPDVAIAIKNVIDLNTSDKNISRIQNGSDFVFTIGAFTTQDEADVIAYIIKSQCGNEAVCEVKAIE